MKHWVDVIHMRQLKGYLSSTQCYLVVFMLWIFTWDLNDYRKEATIRLYKNRGLHVKWKKNLCYVTHPNVLLKKSVCI